MKKETKKGDIMKIDDLPEVVLDVSVADIYKYIVATVTQGDQSIIVIRGNRICDLHYRILSDLRNEAKGLHVDCIGGGRIRVIPDKMTIELFGFSSAYGKEPDRELTAGMIKKEYPEFDIKVS